MGSKCTVGLPPAQLLGGCSEECSGLFLQSWGPLGLRAWSGLPDDRP